MKILKANRIAPDGTPCSAASHLGLFCLPICPLKGTPGLNELRWHYVFYGLESWIGVLLESKEWSHWLVYWSGALEGNFRVCDTSPKTTLPKRHFAETTLCRMRHFAEILPKFGKNAEKDVFTEYFIQCDFF